MELRCHVQREELALNIRTEAKDGLEDVTSPPYSTDQSPNNL